ncbi:hypothetical protein [Flindersiella endophytica]
MLPTYDVDPAVDVDERQLDVLTPYEVVHGFAAIAGYHPLIEINWDEARECVEAEERWFERASKAADAAEFDEILGTAPEIEADGDGDWLFRWNEVGAAGLVLALSAAGYATCTSCRGHVGLTHERAPQVGLSTEPERLRLSVDHARRADCGVETSGGLVWVYGRSVADLHALARLILDERVVFDALPDPPWRARALKALEQGEDFESDDSEIA